jgi:hypothetical protein
VAGNFAKIADYVRAGRSAVSGGPTVRSEFDCTMATQMKMPSPEDGFD